MTALIKCIARFYVARYWRCRGSTLARGYLTQIGAFRLFVLELFDKGIITQVGLALERFPNTGLLFSFGYKLAVTLAGGGFSFGEDKGRRTGTQEEIPQRGQALKRMMR